MRALSILLLISFPAFAQDLTPREGSGWAGFKMGTSVRIKRTFLGQGRTPAVTITTMLLKAVREDVLVLSSTSKNVVGIEQTAESSVPVGGEAGVGEKASTKKLEDATITAAGKQFACACREITVTGPTGKRVIKEWNTKSAPFLRVQRTEVHYDAKGKRSGTKSMTLTGMPGKSTVGKQTVTSLTYTTAHKTPQWSNTGRAVLSRDVPGYIVLLDAEVTMGGKRVQTIRLEALDFNVK